MMDMEFDPQLKAIKTIDRNVAVNAGAGTGKTKVLTERFVYILQYGNLEENKEVESIVAITFTKKATGEMIERIRKEIRNNFYKGPQWTRFYRDMEKSNISTIHSFCGKILRENPIESKIDPLFDVLDDVKSNELLNTSIMEAIELGLKDFDLLKGMLLLKEYKLDRLSEDIKKLYNLVRTVGISFEEVKRITLDYLDNLLVDKRDIQRIKELVLHLQGALTKASKLVKIKDNPLWLNFRDNDLSENELFISLEFIKENIGTSVKEAEKIEELVTTIERVLLCKESGYKWFYSSIMELLIAVDELYTGKKKEISGLDYDDLQIKVLELLDNYNIRRKYQEKYKYIMIDEFQDTNELQKKIFYKLSSKDRPLDLNNLFVVGDPKQSIYAFRGADIDVFYNVLGDIEKVIGEEAITLSKNFRTVDTVLDFINGVFRQLMDSGYDELTPFHKSPNLLDVEILQNDELDINSEESSIYEGELIARRIKQLVNEGMYQYKDFALLFRATTRNFYYEEALKKYNIPFYNSSSKQFFRRQEILDLINALKTISNPYDIISSIGFLRSPMVGLSDNTLFMILKYIDKNIYNTMEKFLEEEIYNLPKEEKDKLLWAKELLDYLYGIKDIVSITKIMDILLQKTRFIQVNLLMSTGKQALANIYKFQDMIEKFEDNSTNSLEDFIDELQLLKAEAESEGVIESENSDVVKLITIHKSKGLQFPVVIIPEMSKDFSSINERFLFNKETGIGIKTDEIRTKYDILKSQLEIREKEERKRVLYVAMTRAEKLLILGGQGKNKGFKSMVSELIDFGKVNIIQSIDLEGDINIPVKLVPLDIEPEGETLRLPLMEVEFPKTKRLERFSISQYLSFNKCKRGFYYDYYKKLRYSLDNDISHEDDMDLKDDELYENETATISALDKGNIIHKFAEHYKSGMDDNKLLGDIMKSFNHNDEKVREIIQPYINNYIAYVNNNEWDQVYIEKPFYLSLGGNYLYGVIDRINLSMDRVEIVDLKSNRLINKDELKKYYEPQLLIYSYAVGSILKRNVDKASLLFLETGEMVETQLSHEKLQWAKEDILKFMEFVDTHSNIEDYDKGDNCKYCKHLNLCQQEKTTQN